MGRALIIKGPLDDLEDLLRIARDVGKKALRCARVKVDPQVHYRGHDFIVIVNEEVSV